MKAVDFNLAQDLKFNLETGITTFRESRMLLFDVNAIGFLRQRIIEALGLHRAREFFLKFGYQNGYADCMQLRLNYQFDSETDLIAAGPVIHTWEGIVRAVPNEFIYDRNTGEFYSTGTWYNSYEAEQHLTFNDQAHEPVCWSLMGYASGYATAFFGKPLITIEPRCAGKGDENCAWLIRPPAAWGKEAEPYLRAYEQFFNSM